MLYREIIAVCSQIHTKYINTLCWLGSNKYTHACCHIFQPCTRNCTIWCLPFRYSKQNSACVCRLCQPHNHSRSLDISSSIYRPTDTHYVVCAKHTWYRIRLPTCHTPLLSQALHTDRGVPSTKFLQWLYSHLQERLLTEMYNTPSLSPLLTGATCYVSSVWALWSHQDLGRPRTTPKL